MNLSETNSTFMNLVDNLARSVRPTNYRDMLGLAAELWIACPPYRQAIIRGTSFFMTELSVTGAEGVDQKMDEIRQARELLNRRFTATEQPMLALQEALGFGGSCVYLQFPIRRLLSHECGSTRPLDIAMRHDGVKYDVEDGQYKGRCNKCNKDKVSFEVTDYKDGERAKEAKLRRIPLSLCRMNYNPLTAERELYFDCSKWDMFARGVKEGDPIFHRNTPGIFLESARTGREVRMSDKFFHYIGFEDASIIDMSLDGWSLPPFFYSFNDVVAILLLQKYNQIILSDYVIPSRYVAPPPTVGISRNMGGDGPAFDPTHSSTGMFADYSKKIASAIQAMRSNPGKIGVFPYPVTFNYMGLDGKQMLAPDMLQHHIDSLMWNMGIPSEFYRGGLNNTLATPTMYLWTLYIRFWRPLVSSINGLNQWVTDRVCEALSWPEMITDLVPPTMHGSPEMMPIYMQRNLEGKLSDETFDRLAGINTAYEEKAIVQEMDRREQAMMDMSRKSQRTQIVDQLLSDASPDMQSMQQIQMSQMPPEAMAPGGMPPGGMPAGPMPAMPQQGVPMPPDGSPESGINAAEQPAVANVQAKAQQVAQMLFDTYANANTAERGAVLREMEAQQPQFAMFVQEALAELEAQAQKEGLAAQRGGGGQMM